MNLLKSVFPITLLALLLLAACTKEQDIVSVEVDVEEPKPGETVTLLGTVRDTSEMVIKNATLRLSLGDIDTEITTDDNGFYEIELPASEEKAIIIAAKAQYNRTIQAVELGAEEVRKDLYLLADPSVEEADLELNTNALFTLRGRIIDQYGMPIPDVFILGESIYNDDEDVNYSGKTDENGFFEFIEEQRDYQIHIVFGSTFNPPCFNRLLQFYPHDGNSLLDLGDVSFPQAETMEVSPNVTIEDCSNLDFINHIYVPNDFNIIKRQLTEGESFTVCDTSFAGAWMYNGVMSNDRQNFNGQYQNIDDFDDSQSFTLCTPEGVFVEARSSEGTLLSPEPVYNATTKTISIPDGSSTITFSWQGSISVNNTSFSYIGTFQKTDANQNVVYELSTDRFYFVNWVTENSGVLTAKVELADGSTDLVTVRFRV